MGGDVMSETSVPTLGFMRGLGSAPPENKSPEPEWSDVRWLFDLLNQVSSWTTHRADRVAYSYLVPQDDDGVGWYVVGAGEAYDFELNRDLARVTILLANKGFPVHSLLFPAGTKDNPPTGAIVVTPERAARPPHAK